MQGSRGGGAQGAETPGSPGSGAQSRTCPSWRGRAPGSADRGRGGGAGRENEGTPPRPRRALTAGRGEDKGPLPPEGSWGGGQPR